MLLHCKNKKKRKFKINKSIFFKNPMDSKIKINILFEQLVKAMGFQKIVETALKNKIHVVTPKKP